MPIHVADLGGRLSGPASRRRPAERSRNAVIAARVQRRLSIGGVCAAEPVPDMDCLIEWLPTRIPADDGTALVHGDFRLDNLVLDAREPRIVAVLDWELATLGSPLADLADDFFRMAAIVQGTRKRAELGTAASQDATEFGSGVATLARMGWALAVRLGA